MAHSFFAGSRRLRLGIWGLGRGSTFYHTCDALGIDVVAGCDYTKHMRDDFLAQHPGAFATEDAEAFLARDFDAVLLATYCPAHARDAIACLRAGKHVLSEVTSFHTMAERRALVEGVGARDLVYHLAGSHPLPAPRSRRGRRFRVGAAGQSFQIEMNYRCVENGMRGEEVPIIFIDSHAGTSKMSKKIGREAVLMVWKLKLGSIARMLLPGGRG